MTDLDLLRYRTRPADGEPDGLLVLLHGRGADEHDLFPLLDALDPERRRLGVTPRAPLALPPDVPAPRYIRGGGETRDEPAAWPAKPDAERGAHWYVVPRVGFPDTATFDETRVLAGRWLDALAEETGIGPERTILGGFSQGAVMSYTLGLGRGRPRPQALVALSGFVPTVEGFELDLSAPLPPVAIAHGTYDQIIPVDFGRRARDVLEGAGADVLWRESPMQHTIDPAFVRELVPWLSRVAV